jgi:hypothetical protein
MFFLDRNLISWQSTKQKVVALFSCGVEYIAPAAAARQGVWLTRLLTNMIGRELGVLELFVDN